MGASHNNYIFSKRIYNVNGSSCTILFEFRRKLRK
nr:MAG TPA: hypothetical protein [Caudoviricetes sp.]